MRDVFRQRFATYLYLAHRLNGRRMQSCSGVLVAVTVLAARVRRNPGRWSPINSCIADARLSGKVGKALTAADLLMLIRRRSWISSLAWLSPTQPGTGLSSGAMLLATMLVLGCRSGSGKGLAPLAKMEINGRGMTASDHRCSWLFLVLR